MSAFYFFHPSDIPTAPTMSVSIGTADAAYPASNAVDFSYAKLAAPAKMTGTSGHWNGDFGSAKRVDLVMLWHNFDAGLSVIFDQDTAAISGAGVTALTKTIVIPAKRADGYTRKVFADLRTTFGYTTGGFRYWRLRVGTNSVPVGMKILFFSQVRQLDRNFTLGLEDIEHQTGIEMRTDALVPWAYDLAAAPRIFKGSALLHEADAEKVREWYRACAGRAKVTAIIIDPAVNDALPCRWSSGSPGEGSGLSISGHSTIKGDGGFSVQLAFEEIMAGDPEWI